MFHHREPPPTPRSLRRPRAAASLRPQAGLPVELRPITPADYEHLQRIEQSGELLLRGRLGGVTLSPDDYVASLHDGVLAQFLVVSTTDAHALALVSAYGANHAHGHAHLGMWRLDGSDRWDPRGLLGMALFIDHLFTRWPFRKLYGECASYNYERFSSGAGGLFDVEGRLREHVHLGGRYWDKVIVAIYRETWQARREHLLGRRPRSAPGGHMGAGRVPGLPDDPRLATITVSR